MVKTRVIIFSMIIFILSGCSIIPKPGFIQYRDKYYLQARSIPPLKIPPGISSSKFNNDYPIPDRNYPQEARDVSVKPPGLNN